MWARSTADLEMGDPTFKPSLRRDDFETSLRVRLGFQRKQRLTARRRNSCGKLQSRRLVAEHGDGRVLRVLPVLVETEAFLDRENLPWAGELCLQRRPGLVERVHQLEEFL